MSRRIPLKAAIRARVFPLHASFDWFALTAVTTIVLYFAIYPFFIAMNTPRSWTFKLYQQISLNDSLTFVLFLEAFLLIWVWLEMPRRRRAESALKRMYSIQRAISRASGRIVSMKAEQLGDGLDQELDVLREMLGVDRISCFLLTDDGKRGVRMQRCYCSGDAAEQEFSSNELPWISDTILRGERVLLKRLQDLPMQASVDHAFLERSGIKSMAAIPAEGESGTKITLILTSVTEEIKWHVETVAQLSVLSTVFASAQARKAALDAGDASELRFRRLFEDSPLGIALLDLSGRIRTINETLVTLLGYSNEEFRAKNILDLMVGEDVPQTWLHLQQLCSGVRKVAHTEKRLLRRDGSVVWGRITISLVEAANGETPSLLVIIENVTEAVRSREQLERSRRMLDMALRSSRTTVWEYDPGKDTIEWLNRNLMRDYTVRAPSTSSFSKVLERVVPEDRESLRGLTDQILRSGGDFTAEFRMSAKDGSVQWMLGKGELLRIGSDSVSKIVGVTVDVSEIKRAHVQLQDLTKRVMEAQEEERKRISRELHDDIGQRVALLAMELDLLRQSLPKGHELRERVERVQASAGELGTDLHSLSHALHSSKLKHLGLEAALRELCSRIGNKLPCGVELDCQGHARSLVDDEALVLFRVTQEALNNVVKHSRATSAKVTLECSDGQVDLTVSDNGCGFDCEAVSDGIGLLGMRERLRAVDGQLRISSGSNGTEIHASVPISSKDSAMGRHAGMGS